MIIFVFGNQDFPQDSLPLRILPKLKKVFPKIEFRVQDPNEEWDVPEELIIIDTILDIKEITLFDNLDYFAKSPNISLHDFDALSNLLYLQKLGKIGNPVRSKTPQTSADSASPNRTSNGIKIIGLPPTMSEEKAVTELGKILYSMIF